MVEGNTYCRKSIYAKHQWRDFSQGNRQHCKKTKSIPWYQNSQSHCADFMVVDGEYSDTQVVDMVELNLTIIESTKQNIVNKHISDVAKQYPNCQISTEYIRTEPQI